MNLMDELTNAISHCEASPPHSKPFGRAPKRAATLRLVPPTAEPLDPIAAKIVAAPHDSKPIKRAKLKPGNPGKRATVAEVQERIIGVAKLLVKRLHRYQIAQFLYDKFGLSSRMANSYIARAHQYLIDQAERPREDFVAEAIGFYEDVLRDPESTRRDKFAAQAALREMLGLDMPFKVAPTNAEGESSLLAAEVVQQMSMEELAVLRSFHLRTQKMRISNGRVT
jgi:hypothetical protein